MTASTRTTATETLLFQLSIGYRYAQVVYVAAKLGIADLLRHGPRKADDLAGQAGVAETHVMSSLLATLSNLGLVTRQDDGAYVLQPLGEPLLSDHPLSLRTEIIINCEAHYRAWGHLLEAVTSGRPGFELATGMNYWDHIAERPEVGDLLYQSMWNTVEDWFLTVARNYDLSSVEHVVDLGGGYGALSVALLRAIPHLRVTLLDLPLVVERARALIDAEGLLDRCEIVGGSFFDEVPTGGDVYILNRVLPDWDDDQALRILERCGRSMAAPAVLLIVGRLVPSGDGYVDAMMKTLNTFVMTGGRHRTEAEHGALLHRAGMRIRRVLRSDGDLNVIEAVGAEVP